MEDDFSAYEHPMRRLARELGGGLEYPPPASDAWVRVVLALAPCSVLVLVSMIWTSSAPFLLTFAGAFASIQLVRPYERWTMFVKDHLSESREQRQTAIDWARIKLEFHTTPQYFQGWQPVGYSPAGQVRARRRFLLLARRWGRSFVDIQRIGVPNKAPSAAAGEKWRYRTESAFDYLNFEKGGKTMPRKVFRSLLGLLPLIFSLGWTRIQGSALFQSHHRKKAERLLKRVGIELIRASKDRDGDLTVSTLARQLGLQYQKPEFKEAWVYPVIRVEDPS